MTPCQYPDSIMPYQFVKADCDDSEIQYVLQLHLQGCTPYRINRETGLNIGRINTIIKHHTKGSNGL